MSLTTTEEQRLTQLEYTINQLAQLVQGAASLNQLNRLLVLAQDEIRKLNSRLEAAETTQAELIVLLRRLQ